MELHCPRSLSSMTRNSIKGLVMQNPSNIDIIAGLEDERGNLAAALRNAADGVFAVIIHRPCPAARIPMFVCVCVCGFFIWHRGPDPSRLPHHRHGTPAEGRGANTHRNDAVRGERQPRPRDLLVQRLPPCGHQQQQRPH